MAGLSVPTGIVGVASIANSCTVEIQWQEYSNQSTQWWDNREKKLSAKCADFRQGRHNITKESLWVDSWSTPHWVLQALKETASFTRTGGNFWKNRAIASDERCSGNAAVTKLSRGDVFFWTGLISQHAKRGQGRQALLMYDKMREDGVQPNSYTFVAALKACNIVQDLRSIKKIHAEVVDCGLESDIFVGTMLVDVYSKCGSLVDARSAFERMPQRDAISWNAMIMGYAQTAEGAEALQLYARMQQEGVVPDDRTYVGVLKACSSLAGLLEEGNGYDKKQVQTQCLDQVRGIHTALVKAGFQSDVFVGNMLVDAYAKCGSLVDARRVFESMPRRDVVSWNAMILGYAQWEAGEAALHLYALMQKEGVIPNSRTFVSVVKACSSLAAMEAGFFGDVKQEISSCLEKVRGVHQDIEKSGCQTDGFVANMLIDAYAKCRSLVHARHVFDTMPHRTVVSWTAIILGYAQMQEGEEALQLYARMQNEGVLPDALTFVAALKACSSLLNLDKGKEIHAQISEIRLEETDPFVASSLIDMYGRCGSLVDAQQVFDALPKNNFVSWSALIAGYARRGETDAVFNLFGRMKREGLQPNGMIFSSLLAVCSHVGSVDEGQKYFQAMSLEFGITPTIEHYTCMIDLLGRAGKVDKAMEMAKSMPVHADVAVWKTVLAACRKWGDVEVGREAFECAVRLDANDAAAYVLISNIYEAADMWEEAQEIQAMRVKTRAWKQPGQSWLSDSTGNMHAFVVGKQPHGGSSELHAS